MAEEPQPQEAVEPEKPAEPPAEQDDDVEKQFVERDGGKWAPVSVVSELRAKRREAESKLKELEPIAEEHKRLKQFADQAMPLLNALKNRPDAVRYILDGTLPQQAPAEAEDPEVVEFAKDLDLYDATGKPDVARAKRIMARNQAQMKKLAEETVKPDREKTVRERAQQNYNFMLNWRDSTGRTVDKNVIDNLLSRTPIEDLANPDQLPALMWAAYGAHKMIEDQKRVKPPAQEPVFVEGSGGRTERVTLSDSQRRIAGEMGVSEKDALASLQKAVELDGVVE